MTCRKARRFLDEHKIPYTYRPIHEERPTSQELKTWITRSGKPARSFFNTSGIKYRQLGLKDKLPLMSEDQMIEILVTDGFLVKRPLFALDDQVLIGYREGDYDGLL